MNYAEDRLDRRARYQEENASSSSSSAGGIVSDLRRAHSILHHAGKSLSNTPIDTIDDPDNIESDNSNVESVLVQLRDGHELAGRSLRDCGKCRHATFHYAMAWMCDPDNCKCAGDYAQMCDLAGCPEIGVLALLYYQAEGELDVTIPLRMAQETSTIREYIAENDDRHTVTEDANHCGCHYEKCGSSICVVAMPTESPLLMRILKDMEDMLDDTSSENQSDPPPITAASILEGLSKAAKAEKRNFKADAARESNRDIQSSPATQCFLPPQNDISSTLQFWNGKTGNDSGRTFPPLLQILVLKLLYTSPVGGPFLKLACAAVPHLSLQMPLSSALGRKMARDYKSHWAYYILIRAVVLGERVKLHRRGTAVPYHVPIWDIVYGLDRRQSLKHGKGDCCSSVSVESRIPDRLFASQMLQIVEECDENDPSDNSSLRLRPMCLPLDTSNPPLFVLGDSHVLSVAWQTIEVRKEDGNEMGHRTLVPYPATGIKAWHTREKTQFFTHYNLQMCLQRLPKSCKTILLSAGEIDCREGIGGEKLQGYYARCDDAVRNTVQEYVKAVATLASVHNLQIFLLPVAPHAYRSQKNGKAAGRELRRERMLLWNDLLREECRKESTNTSRRVYLLDYERDLRTKDDANSVGFVLNKAYNADYTHMNAAFLPHFEGALHRCIVDYGCNADNI